MLNDFGKIAAAEIPLYVPIMCISFFVTLRYGFRREEGWISLFLFSNIRLVGAVLTIISQVQSNPSSGLLTTVGILQALGLSTLLLATLGFVTKIAEYGPPALTKILHVVRLVLVTGVVLEIIAGTKASPSSTPSSQASGYTFSKVASVCFLTAYVALFVIHMVLWETKETIPLNHGKLLTSLSLALPFLAMRFLYSALGAFFPGPSQWSSTTGNWKIYLVMAIFMEYSVVCTYVITGAVVPLHTDEKGRCAKPSSSLDNVEMGSKRYDSPDH